MLTAASNPLSKPLPGLCPKASSLHLHHLPDRSHVVCLIAFTPEILVPNGRLIPTMKKGSKEEKL